MTADQRHAESMTAMQRLEVAHKRTEQLLIDAIADIGDLQARIECVNMRFDEI